MAARLSVRACVRACVRAFALVYGRLAPGVFHALSHPVVAYIDSALRRRRAPARALEARRAIRGFPSAHTLETAIQRQTARPM